MTGSLVAPARETYGLRGGVPQSLPRGCDRRLVGRSVALKAVRRSLGGRGVLVSGAVGIGKTRLIAEAVRSESSVRWVSGDQQLASWHRAGMWRGILVVDDAHLLDHRSARQLVQLVEQGQARVILAVRSDAPLSRELQPLLAGLARVELGRLSDTQIDSYAQLVVGAPLCAVSLRRIRTLAAGNPLYATILIEDAVARGQLRQDPDGVVRSRGELEVPAALTEQVLGNGASLDAVALASASRLALAQPLPIGLLSRIVTPTVFTTLEAAGIARMCGGSAELTSALVTEVLLARMSPCERSAHSLELSCSIGTDHPDSPLVPAVWQLDSGEPDDADLLRAAAKVAAARFDDVLAGRLAQAARSVGAGGSRRPTADIGQGSTSSTNGGTSISESVGFDELFAMILSGDLDAARRALADGAGPPLSEPHGDRSSPLAPVHQIALTLIEAYGGDLRAAAARTAAQLELAVEGDVPALVGTWQALVGHVAALRGDLVAADRACGDAIATLALSDPLGLHPFALCQRALVAAESGAVNLVEDLLTAIHLTGPGAPPWLEIHLGRVEAHHEALVGGEEAAAKRAIAAAELALELDCQIWAAMAYHDATRWGAQRSAIGPLTAVAERCGDGLVTVLASQARAAIDGDAGALRRAGDALLAVGARLRASESYLAASGLQDGRAAEQLRRRAGAAIGSLTAGPMPVGAHVTGAAIIEVPTAREQQIVELASVGRSSPSIARQLGISSRTVENHIARAARKVGADGRQDLGLLLGA